MTWRRSPLVAAIALSLAAGSTLVFAVATSASAEQIQSAQPTISLEPSSGVSDGDTVTVTGTGFSPSADIAMSMCTAAPSSGENCDFSGAQVATSDANGGFTQQFLIVGSITTPADGTIECAPDGCGIGAANLEVETEVASASLSFEEESTSTTEEADAAGAESGDSDDAAETDEAAATTSDEEDGANPIVPITVGVVVVAAGFLVFRRLRRSPAESTS